MSITKKIIAGFLCFVITFLSFSAGLSAFAADDDLEFPDGYLYSPYTEGGVFGAIIDFIGGYEFFDAVYGTDHSEYNRYASQTPQDYYTTPTESVEDENGNVTNYYRGGDTTTTQIVDSYNQTFTTIHNVSNTNDFDANIALENFLNNYTTNTNNFTYNTEFKSWYYDNTSNTYNYDNSQTFYCTDNRQYYISIDNSTDEYYLVNVQYCPTYVTVNYVYNNIDNSIQHGNVTNVYYYELTDGRNSATLSADDVLGLDISLGAANYDLITDDTNTLSLQHFDSEYSDSSTYGREFYSVNRSTTYVDAGAFGKAVKLASGSAAGVKIPGLGGLNGLTIDFRIYYDKISSLEAYFGDVRLFGAIPQDVSRIYTDYYTDHNDVVDILAGANDFSLDTIYEPSDYPFFTKSVLTFTEEHTKPTSYEDLIDDKWTASLYGYADVSAAPKVTSRDVTDYWKSYSKLQSSAYDNTFLWKFTHTHYRETEYSFSASKYVAADFAYNSYVNQWVSMRITIRDGFIYYFVNGDFVGSGEFTVPSSADKFYIKSSGTLYLDELRICTGDMVYSNSYVPSNAPYDTNKILALPSDLQQDVIYVRHSIPVSAFRVGGVRPSNPSVGFLYIPIYSDNSGGQSQLYDGNNWINVDTVIYNGSITLTTKNYKFTPVGDYSDLDTSEDGGGSGGGSDSGSDSESGDGSGSDDGSSDDSDSPSLVPDNLVEFFVWLGEEIARLTAKVTEGINSLIEATLGVLIEGLVSLITSVVEKITSLVDLFSSFGDALGALWSWLPEEIVAVITLGISIFIVVAVIKLFL